MVTGGISAAGVPKEPELVNEKLIPGHDPEFKKIWLCVHPPATAEETGLRKRTMGVGRPSWVPPAALICSTRRITAKMKSCTQPMIRSSGLSG
jgi:hypothetical protein